jgi:peptidyl-dipeptidase Dcp
MAEHDVEIAAITGSAAAPTFANTIEALERVGRLLDRVSRVFFNLDSSNTNDALEAIARDYAPKLAQHQTQTSLDENLFRRIAVLYERRDTLDLAPDQRRLLERYQPEQKARMASIVERLAVLHTLFGQNVLHDERDWQLVLDEADLKQAKAFRDSTEADERGIRLRLP